MDIGSLVMVNRVGWRDSVLNKTTTTPVYFVMQKSKKSSFFVNLKKALKFAKNCGRDAVEGIFDIRLPEPR